jgi:hypothetical protein
MLIVNMLKGEDRNSPFEWIQPLRAERGAVRKEALREYQKTTCSEQASKATRTGYPLQSRVRTKIVKFILKARAVYVSPSGIAMHAYPDHPQNPHQ